MEALVYMATANDENKTAARGPGPKSIETDYNLHGTNLKWKIEITIWLCPMQS